MIVLAAGGTGGHVVPAHVLAGELARRGERVVLFSDARGLALPGLFGGVERYELASGSPSRTGPAGTAAAIARGTWRALGLLRRLRPAAVVGFGGYPSLPALLAALALGVPSAVHEQNAVLGRVNRRLAGRVRRVATSYARVRFVDGATAARAVLTGNPVKPEVAAVAPWTPGPTLRVLVLGGSQGASILSDVVPAALARLGRPVEVVQQCRAADVERVRAAHGAAGITAECAAFFTDVPRRLEWSDLVIARAGASTIAELTCAGRASILIPLPSAMDDHQTANAAALAEAGGAVLIAQTAFTAERLLDVLTPLDAARLGAMATAARSLGRPDAGARLADLVLAL